MRPYWQIITGILKALFGIAYSTINTLAPGKIEWKFRYLIVQIISGISCEIAFR